VRPKSKRPFQERNRMKKAPAKKKKATKKK
jgi:hypothetical protein